MNNTTAPVQGPDTTVVVQEVRGLSLQEPHTQGGRVVTDATRNTAGSAHLSAFNQLLEYLKALYR